LNLYFSTVAAELAAQRVQLIARSGQYRVNLCNDTAATEYRTDDLNDAIKQARTRSQNQSRRHRRCLRRTTKK